MTCSKNDSFTENDIPDLQGFIAIVTGGNSGIGYETAKQLALHNARVYIASRSQDRVQKAIHEMCESEGRKLDLHFLQLDLQDLKSVKAAAAQFQTQERRLDILINNAGIMNTPYELTKDGHERQWQVNYLAPHMFTMSLMPLMLSTVSLHQSMDRVRVVHVSSDLALFGPKTPQFNDVNLTDTKGVFETRTRYSHSKQAIIRDAKELNDRFSSQGVTAYSVHPGIVASNLQSSDPSFLGSATRVLMKVASRTTPLEGSYNSLYCATSPLAPALGQGKFHLPVGKVTQRAGYMIDDPQVNARLFEFGEEQARRVK